MFPKIFKNFVFYSSQNIDQSGTRRDTLYKKILLLKDVITLVLASNFGTLYIQGVPRCLHNISGLDIKSENHPSLFRYGHTGCSSNKNC